MPRILIAEDEAHVLRVISMWLKRHGYDVLEACNGAIALELLDHDEVDMIISDMNMPVLDGMGLIRAVRDGRGSKVPYMLLTARCDQDRIAEKLEPYNVHLYPKPFVPSRLVANVERLLGVDATESIP